MAPTASLLRNGLHCEAAESSSSASDEKPTMARGAIDKIKSSGISVAEAVGIPIQDDARPGAAAEMKRWRDLFDKSAGQMTRQGLDGEEQVTALNEEQFVKAIAPGEDFHKISKSQYALLFRVADIKRKGMVDWQDFFVFQNLLRRPDAAYVVAFRFFDVDGNGLITFEEFKQVFSEQLGSDSTPFDFDCDWIKLYLGRRNDEHVLHYNEFTQLMKGLQGERLRQAFKYFDKDRTGFVSPDAFQRIILEMSRHKLSDQMIEQLPTLCNISGATNKISYSEVIALHNITRELDMVERIVREACARSKDGRIDKADFLDASARLTRFAVFTPMEADMIFHFASMGSNQSRLSIRDFGQLLDPRWERPAQASDEEDKIQKLTPTGSLLHDVGEAVYHFALGGVAGATGAAAVYPIDLTKTRMQSQRTKVVGELLYKNSIDCVRKVYKNEGFAGFYRGLLPQLLGVAPEKAIKLTVNDLIRGKTKDPGTGIVPLKWEIIAGGAAGGCQVIFTNPLEITKIRLQMAGELSKEVGAIKSGAMSIVKQLGLVGLYKGMSACLLRDIPFSAIYFPAYAHLKKDTFGEGKNGKRLSFTETLLAAATAGMPAAYFTTPADVVKTRLQQQARKGETQYKGLLDAFKTILAEEGPRALFKGGPARVLRSSPQFGVTLAVFEVLQSVLPYPFGHQADANKEKKVTSASVNDMATIRAHRSLGILLEVSENFGKTRPPQGFKPLFSNT